MTFKRGYRDLVAWQKAMDLVRTVYFLSDTWPQREQFGLTQQVRRAVVSVPANIAEGNGRTGSREFRHHLSVAHGSLCEVETLLFVAHDQGYLDLEKREHVLEQSEEVGRLVRGLMRSLSE
ncbi:MAG: four helix bundle protein [Thermomicrobiales bacterium]|nr:four helix bundle protein [Thermomicrobiales bacterium]